MKKSRAVIVTALVSSATLVLAACSTADKSATSTSSSPSSAASSAASGAPSSASGGAASSGAATSGPASSAASSSGGAKPGADPVYTRPKVETSPNITIAVEENVHDYNNNTSAANNFSNSQMTALVQPSVFLTDPSSKLSLDGDLMTSATLTSTSPQVVVYKINPKAVWSDGTKVSCSDFYLSWLQATSKAKSGDGLAFDPAGTSGYDQMKAPVCSDGGATVTTTYTTPFADWRAVFGPMVPAHVVEKDSGVADVTKLKDTDTTGDVVKFAATFIKDFKGFNAKADLSAGPFALKSLSDDQVVMVRNDKYWGNPAGPDSLTLVTNSDGQSEVQALQNGEVQVISPQPDAALASQLKTSPDITFNAYAGATYEHLDFNMSNKLFQGATGLALRQAFFSCVDRTDIIKKLVLGVNEKTQPLGNVIFLPSEASYKDDYSDFKAADVAKAKSTMEAAGWKLGSDGIYALADGTKATFRLGHKVIDNREKIAQLVAGSCKKAGINVKDDQDAKFNSDRLPKSDFDMALFAWVGTAYKSGGFGNYTTGGGGNYNKLTDPTVDKLFKASNVELDQTKRDTINQQLDQAIAKTYSTFPLYQFSDMVAQTKTLSPALTYVGSFGGPFWNAQEWVYKQ